MFIIQIQGLNIRCILVDLMPVSFAIVGELTGMQIAIAKKGLW